VLCAGRRGQAVQDVLHDAVAMLVSEDGPDMLANDPAAGDFVADAFAHSKFVGCTGAAQPFLTKGLGADRLDGGFIAIDSAKDAAQFVKECRKLRFWDRMAG
jgi:catalase